MPRDVFNRPHRSRRRPEEHKFNIVDDERYNLEESTRDSSETLQEDISIREPQVRTYTIYQGQQTHVRKKVDAAGKFCDKIAGALVGEFIKSVREAVIPDVTVTIKNECFQIRTC